MYYFVVNPKAQSGRGAKIWKQVEQVMISRHLNYKVFFTAYKGHASKLVTQIAHENSDAKILVAMGGDGTISEIMETLWKYENMTFAYIPMGSGNDFAKNIGISSSWKKALKGILDAQHQITFFPGKISIHGKEIHFGGSMGMGFDAQVCVRAEHMPFKSKLNRLNLGKFTYLLAALEPLFRTKGTSMKLRIDGKKKLELRDVLFLCALKGSYEGGGFMFAPGGKMEDPHLHLCIAEKLSVLRRCILLPLALFGKHTHAPEIHRLDCKKIEILSKKPLYVHGDGEVLGRGNKVTVTLEAGRISMIY